MEYNNEKLEEFNRYIRNRKVAVIGLGVSNLPLLAYLHDLEAKVTVFDTKVIEEIASEAMDQITTYGMEFHFGNDSLSYLTGFDLIFRSPSALPTIPEIEAEFERGAIVTSEIEMVMQLCPGTIIGVTGSDGKTTTTSLIYEIIKAGGYSCYLGGNIGNPLFTKIGEMTPEDIVVLELSSFQLMGMELSPHIAVMTNVAPNHLNVHKDLEEYIDAKKNIFGYQNENDILVLNHDNEVTKDCAKEAQGKVIFFSSKEKLENGYIVDNGLIKECEDKLRRHVLGYKEIKLVGMHNCENICAALAATKTLVDTETAIKAIRDFTGVEHRLEYVREVNGVKWYNDSASSSPSRTIVGLNSFDEKVVLIAGGYDKNLNYTPVAKPIADHVSTLVLIGDTATKIFNCVKEELENQNKSLPIYVCDDLNQAISIANKFAKPGEVVLFSPASASFDMFKNAYDRGNKYKALVKTIEE